MKRITYTNVVFDFLNIYVAEPVNVANNYKYAIVQDNGHTVRQGYFTPPQVQMRIQHQVAGQYTLLLWVNDVLCHQGSFIKAAENWEGNNIDLLMPA